VPRPPVASDAELSVDTLEDLRLTLEHLRLTREHTRVVIQCFDDGEADDADVLEGSLRGRLPAGGSLLEILHHPLEALVRAPPLFLVALPLFLVALPLFLGALAVLTTFLGCPPAVGSHLEPQVAQLFQDQPGAWIEIPRPLVRHRHNLSRGQPSGNVAFRIQ